MANKFEKISKEQYIKDGGRAEDYNDIKIPRRATAGSAGYDFFSPVDFTLDPERTIRIATGIRIHLDDDKCMLGLPRSGLGTKYRLRFDNTPPLIDADYVDSDNEGHIIFQLTNETIDSKILRIKKGDPIVQGLITNCYKTVDDSVQETRNGGFGSTSAEMQAHRLDGYDSVFDALLHT